MIDEKRLIESIEMNLICIGDERDQKNTNETKDCIIRIINNQPKVDKWIPTQLFGVSLPREDGRYLVTFDDGFIATADYIEGEWELWADAGEVIAWMPLPEPYKRSEE